MSTHFTHFGILYFPIELKVYTVRGGLRTQQLSLGFRVKRVYALGLGLRV